MHTISLAPTSIYLQDIITTHQGKNIKLNFSVGQVTNGRSNTYILCITQVNTSVRIISMGLKFISRKRYETAFFSLKFIHTINSHLKNILMLVCVAMYLYQIRLGVLMLNHVLLIYEKNIPLR